MVVRGLVRARASDRGGARFDVFLSADEASVERIADSTRRESERAFLRNRLSLIAHPNVGSADALARVAHPRDLLANDGAIAIGGKAVPVGRYTRAWLDANSLTSPLEARFVTGRNARATLALVEHGAVEFGFVYRSDPRSAERAGRVDVLWTSTDDAVAIEYTGVALVESDPSAEVFLAWLTTEEFQHEATRFGFDRAAEGER